MRRLGTAIALVAASSAAFLSGWAGPARADVDGFSVRFGSAPGTFTIGKGARKLTAEVATDRGRLCRKVRWAMTVRAEGVSLDQLQVERVENDQEFPVRAELRADDAQLVDAQLDPGQLCRDRTVSAHWDIGFTGPDDGSVTFEVRALDVGGRVLASARTSSRVVSPVAATTEPSDPPSAAPTPTSTFVPEPEETDEAVTAPDDEETTREAGALRPASSTPSLLGPGLLVGAVLVFLGVGLLMRVRSRNRRASAEAAVLPTGFSSMPQQRRRR